MLPMAKKISLSDQNVISNKLGIFIKIGANKRCLF